MPYHSPHKFRHGYAVFSINHSYNIAQIRTIRQNLMHTNISIIDGIYGGLSDSDINEQINSLTENQIPDNKDSLMDLIVKNWELIARLEYKLYAENYFHLTKLGKLSTKNPYKINKAPNV